MCGWFNAEIARALALEALAERREDGLDGDEAIEACVARFPHFAHAARTEGGLNLERPELGAG